VVMFSKSLEMGTSGGAGNRRAFKKGGERCLVQLRRLLRFLYEASTLAVPVLIRERKKGGSKDLQMASGLKKENVMRRRVK